MKRGTNENVKEKIKRTKGEEKHILLTFFAGQYYSSITGAHGLLYE